MAEESKDVTLRFKDFRPKLLSTFKRLRDEKKFTDVTISCDGQICKAHRMVLTACSAYFKRLLQEQQSKRPIIVMADVSYRDFQALLELMYSGKVQMPEDRLPEFYKLAARLEINMNPQNTEDTKDET